MNARAWLALLILPGLTGCGGGGSGSGGGPQNTSGQTPTPSPSPGNVSVSPVGQVTVGTLTVASSTRLRVSWTPPTTGAINRYEIVASESGSTARSVATALPGQSTIELSGLKAASTYAVVVSTCPDTACSSPVSAAAVTATTSEENWQLQGSGNSTATLTRIVSDGNARVSATRFGNDAGPVVASRIQLYYGPSGSAQQRLSVAATSVGASAADPASYLAFSSLAATTGLVSPATAATLVAQVATGQAVPLAATQGGKVRLFFEARGADGKTRIMYLDSQDGYIGRDFNAGTASLCSTAADYTAGGGCAPTVVVGVEGDATGANPGILNARQFKLGWPTLDDWRWDGAIGRFMVFTTDQVAGCSSSGMNHGYAVWDGSRWNVQYDGQGCPKLFRSAQAAFPMHIGGQRYKMYYGDPAQTTGRLNSGLPFLGPKKLLYADGSSSGRADVVDFEDWENQARARDVTFVWPNGQILDATAEGYIDDFHFLAPTGSAELQVMYLAITNGTEFPFAAAAVLLNP